MAALGNTISIGPERRPIVEFSNASSINPATKRVKDGIKSIDLMSELSVSGEELSIDTMNAIVQYGSDFLPPIPASREIYISPGEELYISPGDTFYYYLKEAGGNNLPERINLTGILPNETVRWRNESGLERKFLLAKPIEQIGKKTWKITAYSPIGLLDKIQHKGGIYTGEPFPEVVESIIDRKFAYAVSDALFDQKVYGWLPYDSARVNLQRLLVALGASIKYEKVIPQRPYGYTWGPIFTFLQEGNAKTVDDTRISVSGSIQYKDPVTRFEVTEHSYFADSSKESEILFDNTGAGSPADYSEVKFSGPMFALTANGLTIHESDVNYAIVSGTGTLSGKPYLHTTRIVAAELEQTGYPTNVKQLRDDFTLISLANSKNVAQRILEYMASARTIRAKIIVKDEKCGDVLQMHDPFGNQMTAFLQSMDISTSSKLYADCKLIADYVPSHQGNNVSGNATLTGTGVWISPFTGTLTVAVVQGGTGGGAGNKGHAAPVPPASSYSWTSSYGGEQIRASWINPRNAKAGKGGEPGTPGHGGKVYITTIEVTKGQQISYSCGVGGEGEAYGSGTGGSEGTHTVFGDISSESGTVTEEGFIDPISGDRLGAIGALGIAGGDGVGWKVNEDTNVLELVTPDPIDVNGMLYYAGTRGSGRGKVQTTDNRGSGLFAAAAPGGFGGGPAFGANGNNGGSGSCAVSTGSKATSTRPVQPGYARTIVALGGKGASALPPPPTNDYGRGGTSGNGGGGDGAYGAGYTGPNPELYANSTCYAENRFNTLSSPSTPGDVPGTVTFNVPQTPPGGGDGSDGGQGGPGVVRLYWGG